MKHLNELTIAQAHAGLKKKDFSAVELTQACFERIEEMEKKIKAFLCLDKKGALETAREIDKGIAAGLVPGPLEGIPVAIKDNMLVSGLSCTAGSKILENYQAVYDATVIAKLKKVGAVILGKTNMDEFAMGSSTENSAFGPTHNPHNPKTVPGGSSGGSAAAVAANECLYALGSDTGGSIRQPASLCGVVGFKPTYGSVSRYGLIAMSSSLDVIGPLTKTVGDARLVYEAIKGQDKMDATTVDLDVEDSRSKFKMKNLRVGIPKEYFIDGMDLGTEKLVRQAIEKLEKLGAKIIDVSLPHTGYALAVYYILMPSEVSSNLARFDGIRYGYSINRKPLTSIPSPEGRGKGEGEVKNLYDVYVKSRAHGFGDEAKRRIMLGAYALSAGYRDAYYQKAQTVRALIKKDFDEVFSKVDCLVTPTSPTTAWLIGEKMDDPLTMYLSDIYTSSANLAGIPAISIPCGKDDGLPAGLQIMVKQFGENILFDVAQELENNL